jgi:hypothetical protein
MLNNDDLKHVLSAMLLEKYPDQVKSIISNLKYLALESQSMIERCEMYSSQSEIMHSLADCMAYLSLRHYD